MEKITTTLEDKEVMALKRLIVTLDTVGKLFAGESYISSKNLVKCYIKSRPKIKV